MKKLLIGLILVTSTSAFTAEYNRIVPCSLYNSDVKKEFINGDTRELAKACSLQNARKHGENVCESNSFAWQRKDFPQQDKFSHSEFIKTECKGITATDSSFSKPYGHKCETYLKVTCY
jgi:hypothetical protein